MANEFEDPDGTGKSAGLITSSTPVTTGYPTYTAGAPIESVSFPQATGATEADIIQNYNNMSEALRKSLAQKLKSAGYSVPVTGKYSAKVREAFLEVNRELSDEIRNLQKNDPKRLASTKYDFNTFINDKIGERQASFADQYKPTRTINVSPATVAQGKINDTVQKLLGRLTCTSFCFSICSSILSC